jgi:uncharacterized protein YdeI (YjbR/CyaY-like superfamily)
MIASEKAELEILSFKTAADFEKWLAKNHKNSPGIWLRFFKKDSGEKTVSHKEALDEAICYGWIDGQINSYDARSWLHKFTPRRPKSIWSKKNTDHAERLAKTGRMKTSGLAEVEQAKADGRWKIAYDAQADMKFPEDFLKRLSRDKQAKVFFDSLNKANRYSIAWRLQTAKKPETREKRINKILEMLSKGEKFH